MYYTAEIKCYEDELRCTYNNVLKLLLRIWGSGLKTNNGGVYNHFWHSCINLTANEVLQNLWYVPVETFLAYDSTKLLVGYNLFLWFHRPAELK